MAQRQINPFELEYMFKVIGQAVWHLQYLEVALDQLITLKVDIRTPGRVPEAEAWAMLTRNQRDTLGDSIKKAEKNQALDEATLKRLRSLNHERRWLVHRSYTENGKDLYEDVTRQAMLERLANFMVDARALHYEMNSEVEKYVASFGYDTEAIARQAETDLRKLKGEDQQ